MVHTRTYRLTSGVPLFNSSIALLWPVYLAISNLPPTLRMNADYLMLAGVWFSPAKSPMDVLPPVLKAIRKIASTGISMETVDGARVVEGKPLVGMFDLPAKAPAANMKQYNWKYYGCTNCDDEGVLLSRNTRIYPQHASHQRRTSLQMDQWVDAAEDRGCAVMGVEGKSVLADGIRASRLYHENTNLLSRYIMYVNNNVTRIVLLSSIIKLCL